MSVFKTHRHERLNISKLSRFSRRTMVLLAVILVTAVIAVAGRATAQAAGLTQRAAAVNNSRLAVVPFAVPVAVPVAVVARPQVFYAYGAYADSYSDLPSERGTRPQVNRPAPPQAAAAAKLRGLESCLRCHSGASAQGGLDLSDPLRLTPAQKLESIRRMTTSDPALRMPKGAPALDPQTLGQAVESLAGAAAQPAGQADK